MEIITVAAGILLVLLLAALLGLWLGRAGNPKATPDWVEALSRSLRDESRTAAREVREELSAAISRQSDSMRGLLDDRLRDVQQDGARQLEQIRATVDEKLQENLDRRFNDSFKTVSDRLEQVHRGLGEMQSLATGVGDLKKVLSNVRTRGTWGEVQLGALLEQVLAPEQYARNVATRGTAERVEFAIKLPGQAVDGNAPVWLPIDAKFPADAYQRLVEALDGGAAETIEAAGRQLEMAIKLNARTIREKYVEPPATTDFAIMFLPTEGLYAEVLRRPGLAEQLQTEQRIVVAGPMTLAALLNSLQMGFRTLAIQQRSGEVWKVLGEAKTEFARYGQALDKVKKKIEEAAVAIDEAQVRTRAVNRRLRDVEEIGTQKSLPGFDADELT
ncbi:MAG: DNA recombination protein RmuC [Bryobacteraceae bacterium]|nr:DNA recombination protein RmuC [Bryobacteraceae bacterium]